MKTQKIMQIDYKEDIVVFEFDNELVPMGLSLRGNSKEDKFKNAILDINQLFAEEEFQWIYSLDNPLIKNSSFNGTPASFKTDKIWVNRALKKLKLSDEDIQEFNFYVEEVFGLYDGALNYQETVTERRNHFFGGE